MNASDRLWAKYKLGERSKIIDPMTKQPAVRNIFYDDGRRHQREGDAGARHDVLAVQRRARRRRPAAGDGFKLPLAEVRADLIAGFNPGVQLMPSHVMALALAQEQGFTYMKP